MRDFRHAASWLAVACLAVAPFVNGLHNEFVYDDQAQVTRNALVRSLDPRPILAGGAVTHGHVEWYRPLTIYSLALNWAISGDQPLSYHVVNVGLHAANACLVLSISFVLFGQLGVALVAAILFAVHAVHVEAVTPVFGRADLLATFFVLAGWRLALTPGKRGGWRAAAVVGCAAAGLLAKESAVVLFPLVVASDVLLMPATRGTFWRRMADSICTRRYLYAALLVTILAYAALRIQAVGGIQAGGSQIRAIENPLVAATIWQRGLTACWIAVLYLQLFLLPHPLRADYSYNQVPVIAAWTDVRVLTIILLVAGLGAIFKWRPTSRPLGPYLCVFALMLLPISNLLRPIGTIMAERLLYLPSVALCLLVALGLRPMLVRGGDARRSAGLVIALLVAAHIWVAASRNNVWRSDVVLFAETVKASPHSAKARVNYATTLLELGDVNRAKPLLDEAVSIAPAYAEAHNLLGTIYLGRNDLPNAARAFRAALRDAPDYPPALANLGITLRRMEQPEEATLLLRRAVSLDPSLAVAVVNLALLAEMHGDSAEAFALYSRAYALDPSLEVARARARELSPGASDRR
jgi:Tfp pilus assembly protein PilF